MPRNIIDGLKAGGSIIADEHNKVSVLFANIVRFIFQFKNLKPAEFVLALNEVFSEFDDLSLKYGIERIKTTRDNYFSDSSLSVNSKDSALS